MYGGSRTKIDRGAYIYAHILRKSRWKGNQADKKTNEAGEVLHAQFENAIRVRTSFRYWDLDKMLRGEQMKAFWEKIGGETCF